MELSTEERIQILVNAGGKRLTKENTAYIPVFESPTAYCRFVQLPEMEQERILAEYAKAHLEQRMNEEPLVTLEMRDNSMSGTLRTGDKVTVNCKEAVTEGRMAAVSIAGEDGDVLIRRISYPGGKVRLIPDNGAYPAGTFDTDQVNILGRVAWADRSAARSE